MKNIASVLTALFLTSSLFGQIESDLAAFKELLHVDQPISVAYLGSYHMGNPGADAFNLEADDVLSEKRQKEIQLVAELLAAYRPTKIALESPFNDSLTAARYNQYLNGKLELRRSEEEQIGFRLARMLGHQQVYSIDEKIGLDDAEVGKLVQQNPQKFGRYLSGLEVLGTKAMSIMASWLEKGTVCEMLYKMNHPDALDIAHAVYFHAFVPIVDGNNHAGADMVNTWYLRNLRIFSNLHQIADGPEDRILVIFGQGHIPLLKQFTSDSPYFKLEDIQDYLK